MVKMPQLDTSRGAPMGRRNSAYPPSKGIKLYIRHVHIDSGGYDNGGAYWGIGKPLFQAHAGVDYPHINYFARADSKLEAARIFLIMHPEIEFKKYKLLENL